MLSAHDKILERTAFREHHGLAGADIDLKELRKACTSESQMRYIAKDSELEDAKESLAVKAVNSDHRPIQAQLF